MPFTTGDLYIPLYISLANQKNRNIKYRFRPNLEISIIIISGEMPLQALSTEKQIPMTALRLRSQADLPGTLGSEGTWVTGLRNPPVRAAGPFQHLCFLQVAWSPFKGLGKSLLSSAFPASTHLHSLVITPTTAVLVQRRLKLIWIEIWWQEVKYLKAHKTINGSVSSESRKN